MIGSILRRALNLRALLAHRRASRLKRHDIGTEIELGLYANMFQNDFLHAGYFHKIPADPEEISLKMLKEAMHAYARLVCERTLPGQRVLDLGCGTGGLLGLLRDLGAHPTGLTPSREHAEYIARHYPGIPVIQCTFEQFDTSACRQAFNVVVSAESFHNVNLEAGLRRMREVLKPNGKWIVVDYYRLHEQTYNRSGHLLTTFLEALSRHNYQIVEEMDITANTLPTLAFAHCLAQRFGVPLIEFTAARFFRQQPVLEYLLHDVFAHARGRLRLDALDPALTLRDRRYLLHQIKMAGEG